MAFLPEPHPPAAPPGRTAVVLCNLGTPDAPTAGAVRRYLREFLSDPRVVEIPALVWKPLLYGLILPTRPAQSAAKYAKVWTPQGSPLLFWTEKQASLLQDWMLAHGHEILVRHAMRYGTPALPEVLSALRREGVQRMLVLPLYPQYSCTTTASVLDSVFDWSQQVRHVPEWRFVNRYHDHPLYIAALADSVRSHWQKHGRGQKLVLSFHGVPARTAQLGDPYAQECQHTAQRLAQALELAPDQLLVSYQSRFGKAEWLQPYTQPTLEQLAREGLREVDMLCPGFAADCLETLEEINMEVRHAFLSAGGQRFEYIPCLNDRPTWIEALGQICQSQLAGWPTREQA